jgi:hypothetical protein
LATWVLQIMPVFFLVGGYANLAGWQRAQATGGQFRWGPAAPAALADRRLGPGLFAGELAAAALPGPHSPAFRLR